MTTTQSESPGSATASIMKTDTMADDSPKSTSEERQRTRNDYLTDVLQPGHISLDDLAETTRKALDDYARFVTTSGNAPSANWNNPIVDLCRAAECELASVFALSGIDELVNLSNESIGTIPKFLERLAKDERVRSQLQKRGAKPGQLLVTVPQLLRNLARLRSAHGGSELREATRVDADKAIQVSVGDPNKLLPLLVRVGQSLRTGVSH
jgi:hypothetical protein